VGLERVALGEMTESRELSAFRAGWTFLRIVEEELIAVGIGDHEKPVASPTLLDESTLGKRGRPEQEVQAVPFLVFWSLTKFTY